MKKRTTGIVLAGLLVFSAMVPNFASAQEFNLDKECAEGRHSYSITIDSEATESTPGFFYNSCEYCGYELREYYQARSSSESSDENFRYESPSEELCRLTSTEQERRNFEQEQLLKRFDAGLPVSKFDPSYKEILPEEEEEEEEEATTQKVEETQPFNQVEVEEEAQPFNQVEVEEEATTQQPVEISPVSDENPSTGTSTGNNNWVAYSLFLLCALAVIAHTKKN